MAVERVMRLYKLGTHRSGEGIVEYCYPNIFERQSGRLAIATDENQIELLLDLARYLSPPYQVAYVLLESRSGHSEGRYVLADALQLEDLHSLALEFKGFLEMDARHHLRVDAGAGGLVYDQHNIIYAPHEQQIVMHLVDRGFGEGKVQLPFPHSHHIHAELDGELERLLSSADWRHEPLQEDEDVY